MSWIDAGPADLRDGETRSLALGRRMVAFARSGDDYLRHRGCVHP